jgi:aminomethyltransferase
MSTSWLETHERYGGILGERGGQPVPVHYGDPAAEYDAAIRGAGLHHRAYRGLIEVVGDDRVDWLNNLVTNVVKTLGPGEGNYAFAVNAKGRVVFDCEMLIHPDRIWLDVERSCVPRALEHLNHYLITEDVRLADRSDDVTQLALLGPKAAGVLDSLEASNATAMAQLQHATLRFNGQPRVFARLDLHGAFGAVLFVESADDGACWQRVLAIGEEQGLRPVGLEAVNAARIEAGIPWPGDDITDETIPPETLQAERGISYQKGCYLGQEVIERMRSRGSLARCLIGVIVEGDTAPPLPAKVVAGDAEIGRLTSVCVSPHVGRPIALGYVKAASTTPNTPVTIRCEAGELPGKLSALPFRA